MNQLYYGDNLGVLQEHFADASVDLIYLDPPFNSNADYNVIFHDHKGGGSAAQILAFEDTWKWTQDAEGALIRLTAAHGPLAELLHLIVGTLRKNDLSAYLVMMAERLVELHRVLKDTGSLYLHCDPTASHYLKMILDMVFGAKNFRSEIIWKRTSSHNSAKRYGPVHDVILFYTKTSKATWNGAFSAYDSAYVSDRFARSEEGRAWKDADLTGAGTRNGETGQTWRGFDVTAKGRHWAYPPSELDRLDGEGRIYWPTKEGAWPRLKKFLDETKGVPVQDVWTDVPPVNSQAQERLGYPTQKPVALLERIIAASSNPGDVVLDPFCGCGTAVVAAQRLGRAWRGIDITHLSVALMTARLEGEFGLRPGTDFTVEGTPQDEDAARYLFAQDAFQFQFWIVGLIGAQPYGATAANKKGKKGGDTGIDGLLYFRTPGGERLEKGIVSVKGGKNLNPTMVRDLVGTVTREKAALGVFLTLDAPTKGMRDEAAKAGVYVYGTQSFPRIQLLTVADVLAGRRPQVPAGALNVSLERRPVKTAEREAARTGQPLLLFGAEDGA